MRRLLLAFAAVLIAVPAISAVINQGPIPNGPLPVVVINPIAAVVKNTNLVVALSTNVAKETNGNLALILNKLTTGPVPVSGTFWQATQPVSGSVSVSNFPASQPVTGTFWQATQPVSGTFWQTTQPVSQSGTWTVNAGSGFPTPYPTQAVSGSVSVSGTVAISAAALPLPANAAQETGGNLASVVANQVNGTQKVQGNLTSVNGWPLLTGTGVSGPGVPRVTVSSDSFPPDSAKENGGNLAAAVTLLQQNATTLSGILSNQVSGTEKVSMIQQANSFPLNPFLPRCNKVRLANCQP